MSDDASLSRLPECSGAGRASRASASAGCGAERRCGASAGGVGATAWLLGTA